MDDPGPDGELERRRRESFERLFIAEREEERRRRRRAAVAWIALWVLLVSFCLANVAAGWPPIGRPRRWRNPWVNASLALAAFGSLIVFADRAADWLRDRFQLRHGVAFGLSLAVGCAGFAATWCLGTANGVIASPILPPGILLALYVLRQFLAWTDRAFD